MRVGLVLKALGPRHDVALYLRRPLPVAGVALAGVALWAIARTRDVPGTVVLGVTGTGVAAGLGVFPSVPWWYRMALAAPFAWVIGFHGEVVEVTWARVLVMVAVLLGGALAAEFDAAWRHEAPGPSLFAVAALGVYLCVPDTEEVSALLGVAVAAAVLGWPLRLIALGRAGAAASAAVLVWAAAVGGRGRPASIIGAVTCLGLLAGSPLGRALLPRAGAALERAPRWVVIGLLGATHVGVVAVASRGAGVRADPMVAAAIALPTGVIAVVLGAVLRPIAAEPHGGRGRYTPTGRTRGDQRDR